MLVQNPKITQSELAEALNISRRTVQRLMLKMVQDKVITRVGSKKKEKTMEIKEKNINLTIDGMGIVMYSPKTVEGIESGYDYLGNEYTAPQQVAEHIMKGDMVGFCTGTGGDFTLKIKNGYPSETEIADYTVGIRLGIEVRDETICFIDLFWLSEWEDDMCPPEQMIRVPNGYYHVTLLTKKPKSGIWGDSQEICVYLNPLDEMPELKWQGVPMLFNE